MNKKFKQSLLIFFILMVGNNLIEGQQRFNAGLLAGLTASQIDGDQSAGFNKVGITGGLKATTFLTDKMDLSFEILYSQRGSNSEITQNNSAIQKKISLSYVEVPLIFGYNDWYNEEGDFYHIKFQAGASFGRLIGQNIDELVLSPAIVENFNENNVSWILGATYFMNEHWGFSFRYNSFITLLWNSSKHPENAESLRSRFLNLQALYMF